MVITDGSGDGQLPGICEMLANLRLDNDPAVDRLADQLAFLPFIEGNDDMLIPSDEMEENYDMDL